MIKYKILIVDDEQGIVTMLKDYFEFHGYLVYTAMSGAEALKKSIRSLILFCLTSICLTWTDLKCAEQSGIMYHALLFF